MVAPGVSELQDCCEHSHYGKFTYLIERRWMVVKLPAGGQKVGEAAACTQRLNEHQILRGDWNRTLVASACCKTTSKRIKSGVLERCVWLPIFKERK